MNDKGDFFKILYKYYGKGIRTTELLWNLLESIVKQDNVAFVFGNKTEDDFRENLKESTLQKLYNNSRPIPKAIAENILSCLDKENFINYLRTALFPKERIIQMKEDFKCSEMNDEDFHNHIVELFIYFIKFDISPSASPLPYLLNGKDQSGLITLPCMTIDELNNMESEGVFKEIWVVTQYLSHEYDEMVDRASTIVPKNMIKGTTYTYFVPESTQSHIEDEFRDHCRRKGVTDRKKLKIVRVTEFDENNYIGFPILWGYQIYEPSSPAPKRKGFQAHWFGSMDGYKIFQLHDDIVDRIIEKLRRLKKLKKNENGKGG